MDKFMILLKELCFLYSFLERFWGTEASVGFEFSKASLGYLGLGHCLTLLEFF